jgi:hypothetical protein
VSGSDGDGFGASRALEARADTTRLATGTIAGASTGTMSMAMKYRTDWPIGIDREVAAERWAPWRRPSTGRCRAGVRCTGDGDRDSRSLVVRQAARRLEEWQIARLAVRWALASSPLRSDGSHPAACAQGRGG